MASISRIVQDMMLEAGKSSADVRRLIEAKAGEVAVSLLSQNDGRFRHLEKTQTISVLEDVRTYKLNGDFNTARETFVEVNSDGEYVAECACVSKNEVYKRLQEGAYAGGRIGYIKEDKTGSSGPGKYLVLAGDPAEDTTYEFDYYRKPTEADIDAITNEEIVKNGIRAGMPQYFDRPDYYAIIYERQKSGFREHPEKTVKHIRIRPAARLRAFNRRQYNYGKGS